MLYEVITYSRIHEAAHQMSPAKRRLFHWALEVGRQHVSARHAGEVRDLSGAWNDTDSRLVSEEMIGDMLEALDAAGVPYGGLSNARSDYQVTKLAACGLARVPMLVGGDTLGFGKPRNDAHIEKTLRALSLYDKKDDKLMTLSGGMKRRA